MTTYEMLLTGCIMSFVVGIAAWFMYTRTESKNKSTCSEIEELRSKNALLENKATQVHERNIELADELSETVEKLSEQGQRLHKAELAEKTASSKLEERTGQLAQLNAHLDEFKEKFQQQQAELRAELERARNSETKAKAFEVKVEELELRCSALELEKADQIKRFELLQKQYNQSATELAQVKTSIKEREQHLEQQQEQFNEQKASLSAHFKELAADVLDAKSKALQHSSEQNISALMTPFKTSIDAFKKEVQEIHHREGVQQGELRKELQNLRELNNKLTSEAHELSTALKGQKKLQGNWGELVLENVLDRSGLRKGTDYRREVSINTEEGRLRPDVVVDLPQSKHLIIDAKVSLNAYTRYVNSDDEHERAVALKEHVQAMSARINELAGKDYGKLPGINSPEMVFMFVPIESAFVEALKADESLFQMAIEKNVLVATPTTLLTSLNIVRQLWRFEEQNKHTALLAGKAEAVFKKLNSFLKSFGDIKKGLDKANDAFVAAEGKLINGRGNLVKQVGEFKKLAPSITDELPEHYVSRGELELEIGQDSAREELELPQDASNEPLLSS